MELVVGETGPNTTVGEAALRATANSLFANPIPFDRDGRVTFAVAVLAVALRWYVSNSFWLFRDPVVALARYGCGCRRSTATTSKTTAATAAADPARVASSAVHSAGGQNLLMSLLGGADFGPGDRVLRYLDEVSTVCLAACSRECVRIVVARTRACWATPHRHGDPTDGGGDDPDQGTVGGGGGHGTVGDKDMATEARDDAEPRSDCDYAWLRRVVLREKLMRTLPPVHASVAECAHLNVALWYLSTGDRAVAAVASTDRTVAATVENSRMCLMALETACVGPAGAWPLAVARQDTSEWHARDVQIRSCTRRGHSLPLVHFPLASLDTCVPAPGEWAVVAVGLVITAALLLNGEQRATDFVHALLGEFRFRVSHERRGAQLALSALKFALRLTTIPVGAAVAAVAHQRYITTFLVAAGYAFELAVPEFFWYEMARSGPRRDRGVGAVDVGAVAAKSPWMIVYVDFIVGIMWRFLFAYVLSGTELMLAAVGLAVAPVAATSIDGAFRLTLAWARAPPVVTAFYRRRVWPIYAYSRELAALYVAFFCAQHWLVATTTVAAAFLMWPTRPVIVRVSGAIVIAYEQAVRVAWRLAVHLLSPCARRGVRQLAELRVRTLGSRQQRAREVQGDGGGGLPSD